jgi:hypothetical protein
MNFLKTHSVLVQLLVSQSTKFIALEIIPNIPRTAFRSILAIVVLFILTLLMDYLSERKRGKKRAFSA